MSNAPATFSDTGETVRIEIAGVWTQRPVLKLDSRLYAGEYLSLLNPNGFGGTVWSGRTREDLQYNIDFIRRQERGRRH